MAKEVSERTGPIEMDSASMRELKEAVSGAAVTFARELGKALATKQKVPWYAVGLLGAVLSIGVWFGTWQFLELHAHEQTGGHPVVVQRSKENHDAIVALGARMDSSLQRINDKLDQIRDRLPNGNHN